MAETGLYTCDELVTKLKALNEQMDDGTTRSRLDTGQSEQEYTQSLRQIERQYERYLAMLKVQCPDKYHAIVGPSAINFSSRNNTCR